MSLKKKLQQLGRGSTEGSAARASATVFGKHPGWDDHIDDITVDAELLAQTKRWLYVEGIRAIVDDGAWDELEPDQVLEQFDHVFFWRVGDETVIGRLWSSRDGKGRARYPMVACVYGRGLSRDWFFRTALPQIERMREQFVKTESASEVRGILERGRAEITASAETQPEVRGDAEVDPRALSQIAELPQFGGASGEDGQHVPLQRVLYQIDREMGAFKPLPGGSRSDKSSGDLSLRGRHLRVPCGGGAEKDIVNSWLSIMADHVDARVPLLVILPPGGQWCDLVVGDPTEKSLRCLRMTPKALPLVTDVPYSIENEFAVRVQQAIEASRTGESAAIAPSAASEKRTTTDTPPDESDRDTGGSRAAAASHQPSTASSPQSGTPWLKHGGIGAAVVLLIAIVVFLVMRPSGSDPVEPSSPTVPAQYASPELDASRIADANWTAALRMGAVDQLLDGQPIDGASALASALQGRALDGAQLDPANVADAAAANALAAEQDELRQALRRWIAGVEAAALEDEREGRQVIADPVRAGARQVEHVLDTDEPVGSGGGEALLAAMTETIDAARNAAEVRQRWMALQARAVGLASAGDDDAVLAIFPDRIAEHLSAAESVDDLADRIERAQAVTQRVASALEDHWRSGVDREHFRAESGLYPPVGDGLDVFEKWASLVADDRYTLLDALDDPRSGDTFKSRLHALNDAIEEHRQCGDPPAEIVDQSQAIAIAGAQIADIAWDGTRRTRNEIAEAVAAVEADAMKVSDRIVLSLQNCLAECQQRLASLVRENPAVRSAGLIAQWEGAREGLLRGEGQCQERLQAANDLRRALERLETSLALPDVGEWNIDGFDGDLLLVAAEQQREAAIAAAIDRVPPASRRVDAAAWEPEIARYQQWLADAQAHARSLSDVQQQLDALAPTEQVLQEYEAVIADPMHEALANAFAGLDDRISALRSIETMPIDSDQQRERLVEIVENAQHAEQRLAAWRRLGEGGLGNMRALEHELRSRDALTQALADKGRRGEQLLEELSSEQSRRWVKHARLVAEPAALAEAMRRRGEFDVAADVDGLDERTRFNIMLHSFSRKLALSKDEQEQAGYAGQFRRWVQSNRETLGLGAARAIDDLIASLTAIETEEVTGGPDFANVGPGLAGWKPEVLEEGRVIRYRPPASWGDVSSLVFRRVEPPDVSAAYVSTTEVPVRLFVAAVEQAGEWEHVWPLLARAISADGRDLRRGPRSWDVMHRGSAVMVPASQWLRAQSPTNYAPQLQVDPPDARHPVQHVSPAAAMYVGHLLGCRLPTYREWHSAYLDAGGEAQIREANLRRGAWLKQAQYLRGRPLEPVQLDDDVFDLGGDLEAVWNDAMAGGSAAGEEGDVLWFRPVQPAGDTSLRFRNIVGNVAEFVFNDPQSLAAKTSQGTNGLAQELLTFTDQQQADMYVVGSSSLSRPDVLPTQLNGLRSPAHLAVFSDVGFRVAFSEDDLAEAGLTRAQLVDRFLESVTYLTPVADQR